MIFQRKLLLGAISGLLAVGSIAFFIAEHNYRIVSGQPLYFQGVPLSTSTALFINVAELRTSPFVEEIYRWAPHPEQDADYKLFVQSTGFDYERDLDALLIFSMNSLSASPSDIVGKSTQNSLGNGNAPRELLAIAEGRWAEKRLLTYARQNGSSQSVAGHEVIRVAMKDPPSTVYFSMLNKHRVALSTDSTVLADLLAHRIDNPEQPQWTARIRRVAGSPIFAVFRQDFSTAEAVAHAAPHGFSSPQVSTLLEQLQWITIAAQPEAKKLRLVTEGETLSESTTLQLSDVLKGIVLLAEAGLNDTKPRQQLSPALRQAYLELLQSAEVTRLDRGQSKSVRLSLTITPKLLEAVKEPATSDHKPRVPAPAAPAKAHPKSGT